MLYNLGGIIWDFVVRVVFRGSQLKQYTKHFSKPPQWKHYIFDNDVSIKYWLPLFFSSFFVLKELQITEEKAWIYNHLPARSSSFVF